MKDVVIWIDDKGKAGLYESSGEPIAEVRKILEAGKAVAGIDLLYQGEFLTDRARLEKAPLVADPLVGFAGYTFGYNYPLFSQRVRDIMTMISFVRNYEAKPERVHLAGFGSSAGTLAAAARAFAGDQIDRAALDTRGFRFATLTEFNHPDFLPGAVKYGDVPALLALAAPGRVVAGGRKASQKRPMPRSPRSQRQP